MIVDDTSDEGLQRALDTVQREYRRRQEVAEEFKRYLEGLTEGQRMYGFMKERKLKQISEASLSGV